jgi:hypothetical protein
MDIMVLRKSKSLRWFILSGAVGLMISALILVAGNFGHFIPGAVLLWPTGIYGLGFNNDLSGALHAIPVVFGGQFLLYGLLGIMTRWVIYAISKLLSR